jgi:hypothetical protein
MKIQIDTIQKIIKLETNENLGIFFDYLGQILPDGLWREFKLETSSQIVWTNPIIWRDIWVRPYTTPWIPTQPWITCQTQNDIASSNSQLQLKSGVYNVEC